MSRLEELNAKVVSRKRRSSVMAGRGRAPTAARGSSFSGLVVQTGSSNSVTAGPRTQGDVALFSRVAYTSARGNRGQRNRGTGRRKLAEIGREEDNE